MRRLSIRCLASAIDSIRPNQSVRRLARRWAVLSVALWNRWHKQAAALRSGHCGGCTPQWPLSLQWSAPLCAAAESAPDDFVKKVVPVIQDRINRRAVRQTCNVLHCSAAVPIEDGTDTCAVLPTASRNAEARSRAACCSTRVLLPLTADERTVPFSDRFDSTMQRAAWHTQCGRHTLQHRLTSHSCRYASSEIHFNLMALVPDRLELIAKQVSPTRRPCAVPVQYPYSTRSCPTGSSSWQSYR
jgi:hypothetical protein